jgi:hypothetical protein
LLVLAVAVADSTTKATQERVEQLALAVELGEEFIKMVALQ